MRAGSAGKQERFCPQVCAAWAVSKMHHWASASAHSEVPSPGRAFQSQRPQHSQHHPSPVQVPGSRRRGPDGTRVQDSTTLIRQDDSQFRRSAAWTTQGETVGRHGRHNFGHSTGHRLLSEARSTFDNSTHDWISSLRGIHLPNTYRRMSSKKRKSHRGKAAAAGTGSPRPQRWGHGFESQNTVKDQVAIIAAQNQRLMQNLDEVKNTVKDLQQRKGVADEKLEAIEYLTKLQLSQSQRLLGQGGGSPGYGSPAPPLDDVDSLRPPRARGGFLRDQPHAIPFSPLTGSAGAPPPSMPRTGGPWGGQREGTLLDPGSIPNLRLRPNRGPGDRTIIMDTSEDDDDSFMYGGGHFQQRRPSIPTSQPRTGQSWEEEALRAAAEAKAAVARVCSS